MKTIQTKFSQYILPLIKKKLRNQAKFKTLAKLSFNILHKTKLFTLKKKKWNFFKSTFSQLFESKIFINNFQNQNLLKDICELQTRLKKRKSKLFILQINTYRIFKLWYNIKKFKKIKKIYKKNKFLMGQNNIYYFSTKLFNLIYHFEYRLDIILYRSFFLPSILASQKLIFNNAILLNQKKITYFNYILNPHDLIEIKFKFRKYLLYFIKQNILKKSKNKFISLLNYPHLEINYNILTIYIINSMTDITQLNTFYPFVFNISALQQYLFKKL